jgi:two-component system sensor histidine kinase BaeS
MSASCRGELRSSAAVTVRGQPIGEAAARFTGSGLAAADRRLQAALLDAIAGAAGLVALLALVTGLVVARRITRPVARLIAVTRAMTAGDRSARAGAGRAPAARRGRGGARPPRAGPVRAPAELRELAAAFDQMAGTLDRQEQIRRDLVTAVAHELRTPIAVLQAGHEALLDGVAEPTPAKLASLRDEVLRLARMVGDLQDLAAAGAAALRLTRQSCDLAGLAAAAAGSLARRFDAAGIAVDRQLAAAPILADPRWLHQVITNLLSNALKFRAGHHHDAHPAWRLTPGRPSQAAQGRGGPFSTRSPLPHHLAFTGAGSLTGFSGRRPARGWGWERNHK